MDELRWYRCPSGMTRFPLPDPSESILFVAVADVVSALDLALEHDVVRDLRDTLGLMLVGDDPVPDAPPEWLG